MEEDKQKKTQAIVDVDDSGPLRITGNILIKDLQRNNEDTTQEVCLCRCGKSANKPYCDDSHKTK